MASVKKLQSQNSSKEFSIKREVLSSICAAIASATVCNPLEVMRNRIIISISKSKLVSSKLPLSIPQAVFSIYRKEGIRGFWNGYQISVMTHPIFYGFFFPVYSYTKSQLQSTYGLSIYPAVIVSSLFAGSIADLITNPFWVIKTRIQTRALYDDNRQKSYSTIKSSFVTMFQEEGINGFYKGLLAQYLGLTHVFIYFPFYEFLLNYFKEKDQNSSSKSVFYSSTIAKCVSIVLTYPHIVLRAIMQNENKRNSDSLFAVIKSILVEQGIRGFYIGLKYDLMRILPSNAILFCVYEKMKSHSYENASKKFEGLIEREKEEKRGN